MTITLNIPNEQLLEKVLWFLNHLKKDGLEIVTDGVKSFNPTKENQKLKQFENILNMKSKGAIVLDRDVVFNPHSELSNDIS